MKIAELLNEAIRVHSDGLLAWIITVAEAYAEKPAMVPQDVFHWTAMIYANQNLLSKALSKIRIIPVEGDPYEIVGQQGGSAENAMISDIVFNKQLKVYSGGSPHPIMSNQDNMMFRALHDFFAHAGSQAKSLKAFYDRQQLVTPQDAAQLPPFALSSHSFTIRGEMNAYLTHTKLAPPDAWAALFCEIIGQASYYFCVGNFPEQKVAVLDGFDLRNLGVCTGGRAQRMQELLAIIQDPNQPVIQTRVNNMMLDKRRINWALLSTGTANRQATAESINEAGMGHIWQGTRGPYLVMSAWRAIYPRRENRRRNGELRQRLFNEFGLGSIQQQGHWPVEQDEHGNTITAGKEDSIFVPMHQPTSRINHLDEFIHLARSFMSEYDQDAVILNDGQSTHLLSNPNRPEFQAPEVDPFSNELDIYDRTKHRLGNDIQIYGKKQILGDAPAWSGKGNYRYTVADRKAHNGIPE